MDKKIKQTESFNAQKQPKKTDNETSIKISPKTAIIVIAVVALGVLIYFGKGLLIAATVDGSPISRLAIIQELEKASGKNLLDSLITEKVVQNEANAKKITVSDDEINAELKKIENQVTAQGGTLDAALAAQGMNMGDLRKQIVFQLEIEKLVADKISVTDEEVAKYIKDNAVPSPKGQEATTTAQVKGQLMNQKLSTEAGNLITALRAKATIRYFVNY